MSERNVNLLSDIIQVWFIKPICVSEAYNITSLFPYWTPPPPGPASAMPGRGSRPEDQQLHGPGPPSLHLPAPPPAITGLNRDSIESFDQGLRLKDRLWSWHHPLELSSSSYQKDKNKRVCNCLQMCAVCHCLCSLSVFNSLNRPCVSPYRPLLTDPV